MLRFDCSKVRLQEDTFTIIFVQFSREILISMIRIKVVLNGTLQRANEQFSQAKSQNQAGASREQKLKDLAAAYDSFVELKGNLEEGTKVTNHIH